MFSWITWPHKLQNKLCNDYIRICPAVFPAVIIHLMCDTSTPTSVSNLHYAQALQGKETTAAHNGRRGCQSEQCYCHRLSASISRTAARLRGTTAGEETFKSCEKTTESCCWTENVFEGGWRTRTATLDGVSVAESTSSDEMDWNMRALIKLQTRGL